MIIGAVVYKLKAVSDCRIPVSHGRLLHAAFLTMIKNINPVLSAQMHDASVKCFSISGLQFNKRYKNNTYFIKRGDTAFLRICGIGQELIDVMLNFPEGCKMQIGEALFVLEDFTCNQEECTEAGLTTMEYLWQCCSEMPVMRNLTLHFLSPAQFKVGDYEYAFPKPELIFGSLAERWNAFSTEAKFDTDKIKELSALLNPVCWQGESKRYNITPRRGITGFTGKFTYDLSRVDAEYRWVFILLAEFAVFTGVGRLTAQGLGRVAVAYAE